MSDQPATPTLALALLPGELWDLVIDSLDVDRKTLGACLGVCRTFRVRALYHLMAYLELSHVRPKTANPMALLDLFEEHPTFYDALPRRLLLDCVEFDTISRPLQTRALQIIPRLTGLLDLHFHSLELCGALHWDLFGGVRTLGLEGCSFDADELDSFLGHFPVLEELLLASCVMMSNYSAQISAPAWQRPVTLDLQIGCGFDSPSSGSFEWAAQRAARFSYRSLRLGTQSIDEETLASRLRVIGPQLRQLHIDLGQSYRAIDVPSKAAMIISACVSLEELDMRIAYISDLHHIDTPAPSCRSLVVHLTHRNRHTRDQVREEWEVWAKRAVTKNAVLRYRGEVLA